MKHTYPFISKFALILIPVAFYFIITSLSPTMATEALPPLDPSNLYVRETFAIPRPSELAVSPNSQSLYVLQHTATGSQSAVVVVNTSNYGFQSIPLGAGIPLGVAFIPDGTLAYIAVSKRYLNTLTTGQNRIVSIDTNSNSIIATLLTNTVSDFGPSQVAISLDGGKAYVTNRGAGLTHIVNTTTNTFSSNIPVVTSPMALTITPDGSRLYIVNRESNNVAVINTVDNSIITYISLSLAQNGFINSIAISSDGNRAFVVGTESTEIAVLDTNPLSSTYNQQIDTIPTSGIGLNEVVLTPDNSYAFVASQNTDELLVIDVSPTSPTYGTQVRELTVGDGPYSIAIQSQIPGVIAYVSNYTGGTVSVIGYQDAITGLAAANDSPTIIGSSTHLTATISAGTDVTYTWAFGDGSYGNGDAPVHTYPALGSYTAVVTATNQVSQMTATTTVNVVDVPVSGLTASNSSPTIVGNQTFLAAAASGGTNIQYTWAFGDGTYGNGTNPTHTYPAVGNYTAIVTATNTNNSLTASTQVQIIDVAISGLAAANDSPTLLGNATHLFATVSGGTNIQYTWAFGDGSYGNGASPTHIYPAVGNYTAIVTATNSNNLQTASTLVTITVEPSISFIYLPLMNACQATPIYADVVLVLDTSGSMGDPTEPGGVTKLEAAQNAAATFFTLLNFSGDQAALVSFDDSATLDHPLSQNEASLLNALNALQLGTQTRMDLGLQTARLELVGPRHDPDNHTFIIFLTDGYPNGTTETQVLAQATLAKNAGITIYTIGLGSDVNATLLQNVASNPAYYYPSPSTGDLNAIYQQIASSFACR